MRPKNFGKWVFTRPFPYHRNTGKKRYHIHESHVQRAIRDAVRKAKLYKRVARAYLIRKTTEKALHDFRAKIDGFLSSGEVRKSTKDWDLRSIGPRIFLAVVQMHLAVTNEEKHFRCEPSTTSFACWKNTPICWRN